MTLRYLAMELARSGLKACPLVAIIGVSPGLTCRWCGAPSSEARIRFAQKLALLKSSRDRELIIRLPLNPAPGRVRNVIDDGA
jgi:hypothetical protein